MYEKIKTNKELINEKNKLAKKNENYETNPDIREKAKESSKKAYQKLKAKRALERKRESEKFQKEQAKFSLEYDESKGRRKNEVWLKKFDWVINCFKHFLDNYGQADEKVKNKMLQIQKNINDFSQEITSRIDETILKGQAIEVKTFDDYVKVHQLFRKNNVDTSKIQSQWQNFEQWDIGKKIEKLLDELQETDQSKDWYCIVEKVQDRFKERYKGWWMEGSTKFEKLKSCIICQNEPNCLDKYKLSKKEIKIMIF